MLLTEPEDEVDEAVELEELLLLDELEVVEEAAGAEGTGAAGAEAEPEAVWLDELELEALPAVGRVAETVVLVVTVVVVTVPWTHLPPERMKPSLLEQVLQATPPSL